jgi:RNA polymerase sigma factor (sigma-70 family)
VAVTAFLTHPYGRLRRLGSLEGWIDPFQGAARKVSDGTVTSGATIGHGGFVERSDGGILEEIGKGSPEAFEALYDRYSRLAFTVAMRVLSDEAAAEDAVQDAFLSIWRGAASYRPEKGSFRTWLCTIVRYRAIDRLRGESGRAMHELNIDDSQDEPSLSDTWAEVAAELNKQQIRAALDELPLEQRQTIELAYWCGMSQREIGEAMRVPLGTVKGRARLALEKLRQTLQGREETWQPG